MLLEIFDHEFDLVIVLFRAQVHDVVGWIEIRRWCLFVGAEGKVEIG